MNDYFSRGSASDWQSIKREHALKHIEECKRLLAPFLKENANKPCRHEDLIASDRFMHSLECAICGAQVEHRARFEHQR